MSDISRLFLRRRPPNAHVPGKTETNIGVRTSSRAAESFKRKGSWVRQSPDRVSRQACRTSVRHDIRYFIAVFLVCFPRSAPYNGNNYSRASNGISHCLCAARVHRMDALNIVNVVQTNRVGMKKTIKKKFDRKLLNNKNKNTAVTYFRASPFGSFSQRRKVNVSIESHSQRLPVLYVGFLRASRQSVERLSSRNYISKNSVGQQQRENDVKPARNCEFPSYGF